MPQEYLVPLVASLRTRMPCSKNDHHASNSRSQMFVAEPAINNSLPGNLPHSIACAIFARRARNASIKKDHTSTIAPPIDEETMAMEAPQIPKPGIRRKPAAIDMTPDVPLAQNTLSGRSIALKADPIATLMLKHTETAPNHTRIAEKSSYLPE